MVEHWAHQLLILSYFQRGISGRFAELPLRGLQSGMVPGRWSACSVAQTCSTLATLWTGPSGSSVHGILQARILVWVATLLQGNRQDTGIEPVSLTSPAQAGRFFSAAQEALACGGPSTNVYQRNSGQDENHDKAKPVRQTFH